MLQMSTAKITAFRFLPHRHSQHAKMTRRALEQSALYSEKLGIELARGTDAVYFRWFLASSYSVPEFLKRQPRKHFARSSAMA